MLALKSARARVRSAWLLSPWIAASGDTVACKLPHQLVGTVLGAGEDQHLLPPFVADQMTEQGRLLALVHLIDPLLHTLWRRVSRADLYQHRIFEQPLGECADVAGKGGREEQILALFRQQRQDLAGYRR